jgi:hypothetical protein
MYGSGEGERVEGRGQRRDGMTILENTEGNSKTKKTEVT